VTRPDKSLSGTVALITGAAGGIGTATAHRLAREGAALALVAPRRDRLDRIVDEITVLEGHAVAVEADITDPEHAERAVEDTLERFGRLDILINNAEIMLLGTALHAMIDEWDRMVSLNVSALLHVTYAAVPHLIAAASTSPRQVADVVNVSSTAGRVARPGGSVYHLTKFGLNGFTESLRQELLVERVRVGVVEPGPAWLSGSDAVVRQTTTQWAVDVADAIGYIVSRDCRVAVNEMVVRTAEPTW
jgi:NADP-dependent 3-hydroxy acid dehydrogenase YdfG